MIRTSSLFSSQEPFNLCHHHQYARPVCHFAVIVSLQPGCNISIKSMSFEKKLFSFHLRITTCFYEIVKYRCFAVPRSSTAKAFGFPGCQIPSWPKVLVLDDLGISSTINYLSLDLSVALLNDLLKGILSTAGFKPAAFVITREAWTLCCHHQYARAVCHFALIVSCGQAIMFPLRSCRSKKAF